MRRYVGSLLAKNGVAMKVIQSVLRHKQLAHTEKYGNGLDVDMSSAVSRLSRCLFPISPTQLPTLLHVVK